MPVLDQVLCVHETELTSVSPTVKYWSTEHSRRPGTARTASTTTQADGLRRGLNIQVAAATDGTLFAVSAPVAGGRHDRGGSTKCGWESVLIGFTWYADAAYIGTSATVPFKRGK